MREESKLLLDFAKIIFAIAFLGVIFNEKMEGLEKITTLVIALISISGLIFTAFKINKKTKL